MCRYLPGPEIEWNPFLGSPGCDQNHPVDRTKRRNIVLALLEAALAAVDPEVLTRDALADREGASLGVIAIGKASAAMTRGAAQVAGTTRGICVSNFTAAVPAGVELVIGDHPVPGPASFLAGHRVLEVVAEDGDDLVALISGGGSALCEYPIEGVSEGYISDTNARLLQCGASIAQINLVRRHLSAIKNGGLARSAGRPIDTYAISDVGAEPADVIASGPTAATPLDPEAAIEVLVRNDIEVPEMVGRAMRATRPVVAGSPITVIADGHTAAEGAVRAAATEDISAAVADGWLSGALVEALSSFLEQAGPGLSVATGEPEVVVTGDGRGGRNTHAALLAADMLQGTDSVFAAFATDGVDGRSSSAGAIVDGHTIEQGGDPGSALENSDSASYFEATGDLIRTGPTGTNVSDLWVLWR